MNLNLTWRKKTNRFAWGSNLVLNGIVVASYEHSATRDSKWNGSCHLPSLKEPRFESKLDDETEIKAALEAKARGWFAIALRESIS